MLKGVTVNHLKLAGTHSHCSAIYCLHQNYWEFYLMPNVKHSLAPLKVYCLYIVAID